MKSRGLGDVYKRQKEQRRIDGESGQGRNQQRSAEHGHHVLHSDADGSAPAESFFRRYDRARCNPFTVSVDGPTF